MKICFLTDDPGEIGGGPEHIRQVARILREKYRCQVDVISPKIMDLNIDTAAFWQRVKFAFWILGFLFKSDYDIYHSHSFSTSAFLPAGRISGKKVGITLHGTGTNVLGAGVLNQTFLPNLWRWLILNVWPIDFRFSAGKVKGFVTVGNGVDVSEFDKGKTKPDLEHFTVLCVSRRDPVKGVEILEQAIEAVQRLFPSVRLNLVSGRKRTVRDFKTANLYVLPSLSEGLPVVLLEAMAAKLPVITTDVGDCRKIIDGAQCGLVVKPGNIEELAGAIKKVIKDKNRAKMGERGFYYVKENYTWERVAAFYYSSYRRLSSSV